MVFISVILFLVIFICLGSIQNRISAMEDAIKTLTKNSIVSTEHIEEKQTDIIDEISETSPSETKEEKAEEISAEHASVQYEKNNEDVHKFIDNIQNTPQMHKDFDLQKVFLENVNKIGAIAIIVAMIIFIGLVSPYIVLTPLMKIVLGYLACVSLIGGGFYLHKKENMEKYSEVLLGTGFAGLFINTFCAYGLFKLISAPFVIGAGVALLIATYCIADKMKTLSMLIIGLIGAYLTPIFAGAGMVANLYYILFINIISLVYTLRNKSVNLINIINISIAMVVFMVDFSFYSKSFLAQYAYLKIVFPIILWGANIVYDLLRDKYNKLDDAHSMINYAVLTLFSVVLFSEAKIQLSILLGAAAAGYFALAQWGRKRDLQNYKFYDYSVLINIWLIVLFTASTYWSAILWSILGLAITYCIKKYDMKHLTGGMLGYFSASLYAIFTSNIDNPISFLGNYIPLINQRIVLFGVPVLSMLGASSLIKDTDKKSQNLLLFSATTLIYIFVAEEINSIFAKYFAASHNVEFNKIMTYIILGLLYTLNCIKFAKIYAYNIFDFAGKFIYVASLITLVCLSYTYPAGIIPLLNFRCLTYIIAIFTGIAIAKTYENNEKELFKYCSVFLGFMLCHTESVGIVQISSAFQFLISLTWVLYSGAVTIWGILQNKRFLINSGIFLIILTILRIFLYDLANVEAIYKLVAFLALGIILMLVSYIYTKNKNNNEK